MKFGVKLFQTNYCHACHKRFAVFFPLPYAYYCVSSLFTVYDGKNTYNRLSSCSLFLAFRFWWRRKEMWAGKTAWRHAALPSVNAWNMQASDDVKISIQEYDWCENQSKRWQQYEILISGVWTDGGGPDGCQIVSVQRKEPWLLREVIKNTRRHSAKIAS